MLCLLRVLPFQATTAIIRPVQRAASQRFGNDAYLHDYRFKSWGTWHGRGGVLLQLAYLFRELAISPAEQSNSQYLLRDDHAHCERHDLQYVQFRNAKRDEHHAHHCAITEHNYLRHGSDYHDFKRDSFPNTDTHDC